MGVFEVSTLAGVTAIIASRSAAIPAGIVREVDPLTGGALRDHRLMAVIPPG